MYDDVTRETETECPECGLWFWRQMGESSTCPDCRDLDQSQERDDRGQA